MTLINRGDDNTLKDEIIFHRRIHFDVCCSENKLIDRPIPIIVNS
jgi:hypothetical protein